MTCQMATLSVNMSRLSSGEKSASLSLLRPLSFPLSLPVNFEDFDLDSGESRNDFLFLFLERSGEDSEDKAWEGGEDLDMRCSFEEFENDKNV